MKIQILCLCVLFDFYFNRYKEYRINLKNNEFVFEIEKSVLEPIIKIKNMQNK